MAALCRPFAVQHDQIVNGVINPMPEKMNRCRSTVGVSRLRHGRGITLAAVTASSISLQGTAFAAGVLTPHGPVTAQELTILGDATVIMLAVIIPVILLILGFAWWFRDTNTAATYLPDWNYSGSIELIVWSIPAAVITFLGGVAWIGSHDLEPSKPMISKAKPIEVEVVSLDWKWLFIYPDQGIASLNQLKVPAGTPLHFRLTSDSVMNAFFVPELGSQIYTMPGMTTQLNLLADHPGRYQGLSAQFSGAGFSDMRFTLEAVSAGDFAKWVQDTKAQGGSLDLSQYLTLAQPSAALAPATYGSVAPELFKNVSSGMASTLCMQPTRSMEP